MHKGASGGTREAIFELPRLRLLVPFLSKLARVALPHGSNMQL